METFLWILAVGIFFGFWVCLFRKAGYSSERAFLMAAGMCVPLVNLAVGIHFITTNWPIESQLAALRGQPGSHSEEDAWLVFKEALRMEVRGDVAAALAQYELVTRKFPDTEAARDAEVSSRTLRAKLG